jgi:hypothetical protein
VFGDNGSDRVHGFVPGQTFGREASHCPNGGLEVLGKLILDDCMKQGVSRQIRQPGARQAMVFFGEADSFLFIEREPLFGVRRLVRVVSIHGADVPADKTG